MVEDTHRRHLLSTFRILTLVNAVKGTDCPVHYHHTIPADYTHIHLAHRVLYTLQLLVSRSTTAQLVSHTHTRTTTILPLSRLTPVPCTSSPLHLTLLAQALQSLLLLPLLPLHHDYPP